MIPVIKRSEAPPSYRKTSPDYREYAKAPETPQRHHYALDTQQHQGTNSVLMAKALRSTRMRRQGNEERGGLGLPIKAGKPEAKGVGWSGVVRM